MSSFYTYDFVFDDTPSQKYDLKIINFQDGGLFDGVGSSDVNIITQRVLRKSRPYYLGRTQEPVLEFPLTFGTSRVISGFDRDIISSWLFGRSSYKKLYILQDDLNGVYFNCFLKEPKPLYIGNMNYAFSCTVVCDSPWGYLPERTISGSVVGTPIQTPVYLNIYNNSTEDDYLYPEVNFNIGSAVSDPVELNFELTNITDNPDRMFAFEGIRLMENSYANVNNDLQIVEGAAFEYVTNPTPTTNILPFFNKNWFRLVPRNNYIKLDFYVVDSSSETPTCNYEIKFTERVKIGG